MYISLLFNLFLNSLIPILLAATDSHVNLAHLSVPWASQPLSLTFFLPQALDFSPATLLG